MQQDGTLTNGHSGAVWVGGGGWVNSGEGGTDGQIKRDTHIHTHTAAVASTPAAALPPLLLLLLVCSGEAEG